MMLSLTIYSMQMYAQLLQLKQAKIILMWLRGSKMLYYYQHYIQNPVTSINSTDYTLEFFQCADYKVCSLTFKAGNKFVYSFC